MVIQEYIQGDDSQHYSFVSYRDRQNRELVSLCVRKRRLVPIHAGASTFAEIGRDPENEIAAKARSVLDHLQYPGPSSVCFKRDERTGTSRIFEINGRLPLCHSILQMGGIDLPWLMYQDALELPLDEQVPGDTSGTWSSLESDIEAFRSIVPPANSVSGSGWPATGTHE